jgi:uncharacterized protein (DUF2236 family)
MAWRIGRERALLFGGGAALLLQIAHPLVAAGVADHSDFRANPFARLRATLDAMLLVTFGDREQARAAAARVGATHARVRGRLQRPAGPFDMGTRYRATDPELSLWVHATLVHSALETYSGFVGRLTQAEAARYYAETKVQATLFGVPERLLPGTYAGFRTYVREMLEGPTLAVSDDARALAPAILRPPGPAAIRPVTRLAALVTAGLVPERLRWGFGLSWGPGHRAALQAVQASVRTAVPLLPSSVRYWPHERIAAQRVSTEIAADPSR